MKIKLLHIVFFIILVSFFSGSVWSQNGFELQDGKKSGKLRFELVNNLIVIPVEINGVKLSFMLDTGVSVTLLFGATRDTLELKETSKVFFHGLGEGDAVEAIKSSANIVNIGNATDVNHTLYVVFDESINFSPRMGVPIHGILGYDFFKNFVVSINYSKKVIKYSTPENFKEKKRKRYKTYPFQLINGRPFVNNITVNNEDNLLMLIDTGSSDGVWVFDELNIISEKEQNYFNDFLGLGLSGSIYGKRSRVDDMGLGDFTFKNVNVAIPDNEAIVNISKLEGRKGSVGSQLMKRFNIIFNYPKSEISLKKNGNYEDPFYYNMSGLTIEHAGLTVVQNKIKGVKKITGVKQDRSSTTVAFDIIPIYDVFLTPSVVVAEVRGNSNAAIADIRVGDKLLQINGKFAHEYKLYEITSLFSSKEGKLINLMINRNGHHFKKKFYLKKLF